MKNIYIMLYKCFGNPRPLHICRLYFGIVKFFAGNISVHIRCEKSFSITINILSFFPYLNICRKGNIFVRHLR